MRSIKQKSRVVPAARSEGLLVERVGDETVIYDAETKQAHCLKSLAAAVFDCCDGSTSVAQAATTASGRLGTSVSEDDVTEALRQLEQLRLVEVPLVVLQSVDGGDGVSRREVLRRIGLAGVAATGATMITSIAVPGLALAASGVPTGCSGCNKNSDCTSGHCCQSNAGKSCNQNCCVGSNNSCHFVTTAGTLSCTVCLSETGCGACPCSSCPAGSSTCCNSTC